MKTINEIQEFAQVNNAVAFDNYCKENKIDVEWLDVTLTDFNEDYYNVYLPQYDTDVMYCDGKLEEFNIN